MVACLRIRKEQDVTLRIIPTFDKTSTRLFILSTSTLDRNEGRTTNDRCLHSSRFAHEKADFLAGCKLEIEDQSLVGPSALTLGKYGGFARVKNVTT